MNDMVLSGNNCVREPKSLLETFLRHVKIKTNFHHSAARIMCGSPSQQYYYVKKLTLNDNS